MRTQTPKRIVNARLVIIFCVLASVLTISAYRYDPLVCIGMASASAMISGWLYLKSR